MSKIESLKTSISQCRLCEKELPLEPRPVVRFSSTAKIIIIGQAPGTKVHNSGIPWDDASGDRLREWLQVDKETFYDESKIAIVPMGFCYPGKGKSGDLPPRPECAETWHKAIWAEMPDISAILLIGQYAQKYYLNDDRTLTERVKNWKDYMPKYYVLPHPSPRNNIWLKKNEWFTEENIPALRQTLEVIK
ncbi:uracil-DNA glycosylase family protein [Alteromonadaceae bacterium M269]|nr:uracil-DNA glycosylase family protein [Alteromonadaceae bacterium M269]